MTVRNCLKAAKAMMVAAYFDLYGAVEQSATDGAEVNAVLSLIESVAVPTWFAQTAAVERWLETKSDADGVRARDLANVDGSDVGLWTWLNAPDRKREHVIRAMTSAILKAGA